MPRSAFVVLAAATAFMAQSAAADVSAFIGSWGLSTCQHPEANRTTCEKPVLTIKKNGEVVVRNYSVETGKVKQQATVYYKPGKKNQLVVLNAKSDKTGENYLKLSKEKGVTVLTFDFKRGKDYKYLRIADLKRGYQSLLPGERVKVAKFSSKKYENQQKAKRAFNTILEFGAAYYDATNGISSGKKANSFRNPANGTELATVAVGQKPAAIKLTGRCGLPASAVSQNNRKAWYNEAKKAGRSDPFQSNASAKKEISSVGTPAGYSSLCEATSAQVYAFLPSLNQAITSSNKLHNGNGVGLRCGARLSQSSTA